VGELIDYQLRVNGRERDVAEAWLGESLLYVLRERLGLPGSKNACEQGECGSCSVLMDGKLVCSCMVLAASAVGSDIVTVEDWADGDDGLSDIQAAFVAKAACSAAFAPRALWSAFTTCSNTILTPLSSRSARPSRATCAGAPATPDPCSGEGRTGDTTRVSTVLDKLRGRLGQSAPRPDGVPKVRGQFAFSSDMFARACSGVTCCAHRIPRRRSAASTCLRPC